MPNNLRLLGVHGQNAPTVKSATVLPADFGIGGICAQFERKYAKVMEIDNPQQETTILGYHIDSSFYGKDTTKQFWDNLAGTRGKLFVKSHVGYTGSAIDAVVASAVQTDQNGLAAAIALGNSLATNMNAHAADGTEHTTHVDATNFPLTSPTAQDITTLITLINEMITKYGLHEIDAAKASLWSYHKAQETGTHALTSTTAVTDITSIVAMLSDMKTKYNAHDADASAHGGTASTHQVSVSTSSTPANTLELQAAYQTELEYGVSGNRTGYMIENGIRYTTKLAANVAAAATSATFISVSGIKIGDIITIAASGGIAAVVPLKITGVNESANQVSWTGAFSAGATTGVTNDVVDVPGFKIHTWRKSITGLVDEIDPSGLGSAWCTMEPEVTSYYVQNVHATNNFIKVTDQTSVSTLLESWPNSVSTVTYLASGADGTAASTSAHWSLDRSAFDGIPVRIICAPESTDTTINKDWETYCRNRTDNPFFLPVLAENQTIAQLMVLGASYQRSNDVYQVNVAEWVQVDDPFNSNPNAPYREVPNAGMILGAWIQSINTNGVHYIPAVDNIILVGIRGLKNSNLGTVKDSDRTNLANYGINIIQFVSGSGYRIRNFFTPSTAQEYMFANGLLMRNFIKTSAETSLASSENKPNSFGRIKEDGQAVKNFLDRLWDKGSTGNVPVGETFGQQVDPVTLLGDNPDDHYLVQAADPVINPLTSINQGNRNINVQFTFPSPAGSILISVALWLK